ncbi:MAG: PEP-CTERM sorting domain-containing protein [Pirellulales bacterium]
MVLVQFVLVGSARSDSTIATWQHGASAAITLSHDDNRWDFINVAAPAMAERGLVGSFNVNPGFWPNTTWGKSFAAAAQAGNELVDHTMFHQAARIVPANEDPTNKYFHSLDAFKQDIASARAVLGPLQFGGRPTVSFCYPYGQNEPVTRDVLKQSFLSARISSLNIINPPRPSDMYFLGASYVGNPTGYTDPWNDEGFAYDKLNGYLNAAISQGGWAIEEFHDIVTPGYANVNPQAYYRHLDDLSWMQQTGNVWVATQGDVTRYIYSRNAAKITPLATEANLIKLAVDDLLADTLYDVPLTVKTEIPLAWGTDVVVTHNSETLPTTLLSEYGRQFVQYAVLADGKPIQIVPTSPIPPPPLFGDTDLDGKVDIFDVARVQITYGQSGMTWADGDFDGNGTVDIFDIALMQPNYGMGVAQAPAASPSAVPEPATLVLLVIGLVGLLACARRRK